MRSRVQRNLLAKFRKSESDDSFKPIPSEVWRQLFKDFDVVVERFGKANMIRTAKCTILLVAILALTVSAQDKSKSPEPLSPIPLTAVEAQPLRDAFTNEQMAQLALAKAQAEKRIAFYEYCDKHNLKPGEWEIRPDGLGNYIAVKIQKKGDASK